MSLATCQGFSSRASQWGTSILLAGVTRWCKAVAVAETTKKAHITCFKRRHSCTWPEAAAAASLPHPDPGHPDRNSLWEKGPGPPPPGSDEEVMQKSDQVKLVSETLNIVKMVKAFRNRGHFMATLDPLERTLGPLFDINETKRPSVPHHAYDLFNLLRDYPKLNLAAAGLNGVDPDKKFFLGNLITISDAPQVHWTINELVALLRGIYCGNLTVEYAHLAGREQKEFVRMAMEHSVNLPLFPDEEKRSILRKLVHTDVFERFLAKKFPSAKRFGIEGCESLIPGLLALFKRSADAGVENIELGMAHRGRLNVLHTLLSKPLGAIVREFKASANLPFLTVGDVKYHLGTRGQLIFGDKKIDVSLSPNPSHLEAVDPVVVGKTRARQFFKADHTRHKVMGVLLHGDAAFSGLGLPAEVMQLSNLPEYTTGGTIHVIINNQIGFTTDPKLARSTPHPSDVAKGVGAPIFHVNGDDPAAVCRACEMAADYRQRFLGDVVVDIVCYRRHGHNEQDDPSVTMPLTYKKISTHPTTLAIYSRRLLEKGLVSEETIKKWVKEVEDEFEQQYVEAAKYEPSPQEWLSTNWQGDALGTSTPNRYILPTGIPFETLREVGRAVSRVPEGFKLHRDVATLLSNRARMIETGKGIDWAMAEALAFGSLMMVANPELGQTKETYPHYYVRLSGQDCERGTFNQRHAVLYDQETSERYVPLNNIAGDRQATFLICNSSLSEAAILGFEYGFSLGNEDALVVWEAQFGDFANNAQSIIDNFIASGEDKWMTPTSLVMLLPHGYDGQGPEHSSARLERFLQLSNDDPDHLPGLSPQRRAEIEAGFAAADTDGKGYLLKEDLMRLLETMKGIDSDRAKELLQEKELDGSEKIERDRWIELMVEWMRRNAERDHNIIIVNVSTPANYFHVLRRQMHRRFAKPLMVMSPKFLCHHSACRSELSDIGLGTYFRRVIVDGDKDDNLRHLSADLLTRDKISRVILCSGKIFYLLAHARQASRINDILFVRIEQIVPFPYDPIGAVLNNHPDAEFVWVQEEPKNMGAWSYVQPRLATAQRELFKKRLHGGGGPHEAGRADKRAAQPVKYIGRAPSASPATGSYEIHQEETKAIIASALKLHT